MQNPVWPDRSPQGASRVPDQQGPFAEPNRRIGLLFQNPGWHNNYPPGDTEHTPHSSLHTTRELAPKPDNLKKYTADIAEFSG
jgi:hypothetical protein